MLLKTKACRNPSQTNIHCLVCTQTLCRELPTHSETCDLLARDRSLNLAPKIPKATQEPLQCGTASKPGCSGHVGDHAEHPKRTCVGMGNFTGERLEGSSFKEEKNDGKWLALVAIVASVTVGGQPAQCSKALAVEEFPVSPCLWS